MKCLIKEKLSIVLLFLIVYVFIAGNVDAGSESSSADTSTLSDTEIMDNIKILNTSQDERERYDALERLYPNVNSEVVLEALANELERIKKITPKSEGLADDYLDVLKHICYLSDTFSDFRLKIVVDNVEWGGITGDILKNNSDRAIPLLLKRIKDLEKIEDSLERDWPILCVLLTLSDIGKEKQLSDDRKKEFQEIFLHFLNDKGAVERECAAEGLGYIGDITVIEKLKKVAKEDPYKRDLHDNSGKKIVGSIYEVREKAKSAIEKIKSREKSRDKEEKKTK